MFIAYTILLMLSGLLLIGLGVAVRDQGTASRVISILVGLAFFGYGFYLEFLFTGVRYRVFFYVFVVPILVIYRVFQAHKAAKAERAAQVGQPAGAPQGQSWLQSQPQGQNYPAQGYGAPHDQSYPPSPGQAYGTAQGHQGQGYGSSQGQGYSTQGYGAPQGQQGYPTAPGQAYGAPQGQQGYPPAPGQGYPAPHGQQEHPGQPGYPTPYGQ